jgi:ABC-type uncharacterized transport system permease subunit
LLAFWATRADSLLALQHGLMFLLGGQVAPTILLPGALRIAADHLPFRFMLGFPVEILTGQLGTIAVWSLGILFTWVFDGIFQPARYPTGIYPWWLRFTPTWVIPVGVMTTVPARALNGKLSVGTLCATVGLTGVMLVGASTLFRVGLRRYASASS